MFKAALQALSCNDAACSSYDGSRFQVATLETEYLESSGHKGGAGALVACDQFGVTVTGSSDNSHAIFTRGEGGRGCCEVPPSGPPAKLYTRFVGARSAAAAMTSNAEAAAEQTQGSSYSKCLREHKTVVWCQAMLQLRISLQRNAAA